MNGACYRGFYGASEWHTRPPTETEGREESAVQEMGEWMEHVAAYSSAT